MTTALCFNCGEMKMGALVPCDECGVGPTGNVELDIAFSDHHFTGATLDALGSLIKNIKSQCRDQEQQLLAFLYFIEQKQPEFLTLDLEQEVQVELAGILERSAPADFDIETVEE